MERRRMSDQQSEAGPRAARARGSSLLGKGLACLALGAFWVAIAVLVGAAGPWATAGTLIASGGTVLIVASLVRRALRNGG